MSEKKKQYYAVRSGREPGIYRTWEECKAQVDGYAKAQYKGFVSLEEAEAYMGFVSTNNPDARKPSSARPFNPPGAPKKKLGTEHGEDETRALGMLVAGESPCRW